jgi:hypothetical protein
MTGRSENPSGETSGSGMRPRDPLAPVCSSFKEGFDNLDPKEAKALLGELA